ncbi:MAG TPA: type 1 glutamine amidotransferase [Solirubrobacterales bacterium]|nr:type 1 glutamine amidotransferase [Solirubrobacterales bacterium]
MAKEESRALAIVFERDAGPGVFAQASGARGVDLDSWIFDGRTAAPRELNGYDAVLVFGGSMHPDQEDAYPWLAEAKALLRELLGRGTPLLGVCLGGQLLADAVGPPSRRAREPELGWYEVELTPEGKSDPVLGPLAPRFTAFEWHRHEFRLPRGGIPLAKSAVCLQAYRVGDTAWGIQFHAEVTPEDADAWIQDDREKQDATRIVGDFDAMRKRTRAAMGTWNELGRGLCDRFLAAAATRA